MSRRAPSWVADFYDRKSRAAGPSGILEHHRERAQVIADLTGGAAGRVLELGCGAGGAAVATAALGFAVTAVELSPVRAQFARDLAGERCVDLHVIEGDFMSLRLPQRFDTVAIWNGFGVGSDDDQRALLGRVAAEWLAPDGVTIMDVFNPVGWARLAGHDEIDEESGVRQRIDYDAEGDRFVDQWFFDGDEAAPQYQSLRCYSPADLRLLTADLPLSPTLVGWHGDPHEAWGWRVLLRRT